MSEILTIQRTWGEGKNKPTHIVTSDEWAMMQEKGTAKNFKVISRMPAMKPREVVQPIANPVKERPAVPAEVARIRSKKGAAGGSKTSANEQ